MTRIIAASLGILAVSRLPVLPTWPDTVWPAVLALSSIVLLFAWSRTRWLGCLCLGALWALNAGHNLIGQQLPAELDGRDLLVSGVISDLPQDRGNYQRFPFTIHRFHNLHAEYVRKQQLPERVQLSWYGQHDLRTAQTWTLRVKLRRPRGFLNEGGFDYQRWLLSEGIGATGYVRPSVHNKLQNAVDRYPVQVLREEIRDWITGQSDDPIAGLLLALAIGDTSAIATGHWKLLRATGTSHLMAISGLHIGLVALLGFWLGHGVRALVSLGGPRLAALYWLPSLMSCAFAGVYSALAGFGLPTRRALIMVLLVNLAIVFARVGSSMRALAWAMLAVLLLDPLAGYDLGFWLSFGAVGVLLFHFQHRYGAARDTAAHNRGPGGGGPLRGMGRAQWVVFVGLAVPLLALNQPLSLLAPVANLLAVPVLSFLVVPPLLSGVLFGAAGLFGAEALVWFAATVLDLCLEALEWLNRVPETVWFPTGGAVSLYALVAGAVGVLLLLSPRGIPGRWLGALLLLPLLLPARSERPPLMLTVLDVGQGLALVISTRNRVLVYDTGPAYSERFNAGDAIVAPYLRARGIHYVDRLVVSHGDADHAGGTQALLTAVEVGDLVSGDVLSDVARAYPDLPMSQCDRNRNWEWEGVEFRLIAPQAPPGGGRNDRSCILSVTYGDQRLLIPGDIEAGVERNLLDRDQLPKAVTVLVAPHHGSATSSSAPFISHVRPRHVVYSTAYHSPHGHPHPEVAARYRAAGSEAHNTGETGQLEFIWDARGHLQVSALRLARRRYWFDGF